MYIKYYKDIVFFRNTSKGKEEQQAARHAQGEVRRPTEVGHRKVRRPNK